MPYCPNCGDSIDSSQNYCEKCGSAIPESIRSQESIPAPTATTQPSETRQGGLFDINRNYYILKEKYWDI
ncbi:MAG: zinc ribbon domain-containing protein [Promethearchaeota archaeon]|nr:MAG: zinc ribbon domain-containing protein [Candidatus Lokiarchaeota archaeon]